MDDRGDVVLGWLTKLVAALAVVGVLAFDLISLGTTRFQAEDHAQLAARAAVESYKSSRNLQVAYEAAVAEVVADGDTIDPASFSVSPQGEVTLTLLRTAPTMVIQKIGPLRPWADMTSTVSRRPVS